MSVAVTSQDSTKPLSSAPRVTPGDEPVLSSRERRIALALAEAVMPGASGGLGGGDEATVDRFEHLIVSLGPEVVGAARASLWAAEVWTVRHGGGPLSSLSLEARGRALEAWARSSSRYVRWMLRALVTPLKSAHFDHPSMFEHVGCRYGVPAPSALEPAPWMQQVTDGRTVETDLDLECEVVVIGTGAGGAAAAYELAKLGRAVLLLEAGDFHTRADFDGHASSAHKKMYLGLGSTFALGNVATPVWAGRGVGGSTTINSGTCYRAPFATLERWGERYGLKGLSSDALAPYYERVESMLGVAEAQREHLGGSARVIARGAELMGLSHKPLSRNAPGCDGQGLCCFGCPTGAKRSTDVSYVPEALKRGAQLVTGARVRRVNVEGGRARGVTARLASGRTLEVRAEAVVAAGGALLTPLLLRKSGLCTSSGWLGKNLSIHPASKVMALFGEVIDMSRGIPQSYTIDEYAGEGLMFEGGSTPLDVAAVAIPLVGRRFMDVMDNYANLATFGFMIQDKSRGVVRQGPNGLPLIFYDLNDGDVARMQRGIEILCEVFLKAGAERVLPMMHGCEELRNEADLARLRKRKLRAGDFEVTAFHPLGTCRMGTDPARSCVGPDHEAHDVKGLFVADGSAIPSSLGVNPQMTIMALALRAAETIDGRLDELNRPTSAARSQVAAPPKADDAEGGTRVVFRETMRGTFRVAGAEARSLSFTMGARSGKLGDLLATRRFAVEGALSGEGFGTYCPLEGTVTLDVLVTGHLPYDFTFTADDGKRYRFTGKKTVSPWALLRTMTHLPAEILDEAGAKVADAEVFFDMRRDLGGFLRSWHLAG
ncbi:MAG TPA: GMC family oxidoreductase [Polyangiaceae bacterium]